MAMEERLFTEYLQANKLEIAKGQRENKEYTNNEQKNTTGKQTITG